MRLVCAKLRFNTRSFSKTPIKMATKTVLILGSGPRIGEAVSEKFAAEGYKVAIVSRKGTDSVNEKGYLSLSADFANTDPSILASVFDKFKSEFSTAPSVVIYNAGSITPPPDAESALSIPSARVANDLNVNVVTPFIAAQEAIKGWETLPEESKKVFIYTGNICNVAVLPVPLLLNGGMGKAATAYWLGVADGAYTAKGYRFIYADQRQADGKIAGQAVNGPAHADFYSQLAASGAENVPWHATFVKDQGYTKF
ncbi:hypothetical protein BCIN_16g01870 [Botrytis cinerea B05.10]|uniref:Uncharacterized protein n=4 Tax=Botryotinia fuckeliana TaxID=40559 RepID=A0A384K6D2_BOTFB|nr:hypothetical protein BCIN_16g01870 [Botrytis cinerea B05.10]ATZ58390.1 hypothetical protein BCIN_16g01870 [Botrytis cinerea B05.10]